MKLDYKNITILFLLLLFTNCDSKNISSFNHLKNAFYQWNQKNHINTDYDFTHNYFKRYSLDLREQYIEDLKRFDLELSQININNLSSDLKIDYIIINNKISDYLFNIQNLNINKYEANFYIQDIFFSIDLLLNKDIEFYRKIELLDLHLINVLSFIKSYKKSVYLINQSDKIVLNKKISSLVSFIDQIPTNFNILDNTYIQIESNISEIVIILNKMNHWFEYEYSYTGIKYNNLNNNYKFALEKIFTDNQYEYKSIINFIKKNIKSVQKKVIDESLILYNRYNDEPVWVDRSDTINVINWIKNTELRKKNISKESYLEALGEAYNLIDINISKLNLNNYSQKSPIFKKNIYNNIVDDFLYSNSINSYSINTNKSIPYSNKYKFNDLVFKYIIPEYNILNSFKKNINPLRSLNTSFSKRGISLFLENVLLLNDFTKDNLYKINFYINLLEIYSIVLSQNDFFINNYDKDKIIQQISIDNFIGINESSNVFKRINTNEFYIEDILVFLHLLNLYENHCVINSTLNINEYIDNILSKGSIPFYLIDGK